MSQYIIKYYTSGEFKRKYAIVSSFSENLALGIVTK